MSDGTQKEIAWGDGRVRKGAYPFPTSAKLCCPRCDGKGFIEITAKDIFYRKNQTANGEKCRRWRNEIRKIGKEMVSNMSLRQIGALIGTKSPQQVKHHLVMIETNGWENFE